MGARFCQITRQPIAPERAEPMGRSALTMVSGSEIVRLNRSVFNGLNPPPRAKLDELSEDWLSPARHHRCEVRAIPFFVALEPNRN